MFYQDNQHLFKASTVDKKVKNIYSIQETSFYIYIYLNTSLINLVSKSTVEPKVDVTEKKLLYYTYSRLYTG